MYILTCFVKEQMVKQKGCHSKVGKYTNHLISSSQKKVHTESNPGRSGGTSGPQPLSYSD